MGLADLSRKLFERQRPLSPADLKGAKPLRNPAVEEAKGADGELFLRAPLSSQGKGVLGSLAKAMKAPDTKTFELERVGSFVWSRCDGRHTFEGIVKELREEFKMSRVEAQASLEAFLQMLAQRRLITLLVKKK